MKYNDLWLWFLIAIVVLCAMLSGCSTVYYPSGKKSACLGSNVGHFALLDGSYSVTMDKVDNAIIIQKGGAAVSQGLMSYGGSALTGGIVK